MSTYRLTTLGSNTELLTLPFGLPLADWDDDRIVHVPRGISRHVVRFVRCGGEIFAIKEATDRYVLREHKLLRDLDEDGVPCVQAYGTVIDRRADDGEELGGLLITRHLSYSQPYRRLFTDRGVPQVRARLIDALAALFVRLHLAGFYWGDCSLSNTLFRRDANGLAAFLVDAETGELHNSLTRGQRQHDLEIATTNIAGELMDLQASGHLDDSIDPIDTAMMLEPTYTALWDELNRDEVVDPSESYRIHQRIKRLNDLGFDVSEMQIHPEEDGRKLRLETHIFEPGHHARKLFALTGLQAQENQARSLLADIARFRAKLEDGVGHEVLETMAARRWLDEKYYATLDRVPEDLRGRIPDEQVFFEIGEHRWLLSEAAGHDVGRDKAIASYVDTVLRFLPDTEVDLSGPSTEEFSVLLD